MSFVRFFYDPQYTLEDFHHDATNGSVNGGRRANANSGDDLGLIHRGQGDTPRPFRPRMDVHENSETNEVTATFELPGMKKSDIYIDIHDGNLVVSGESQVATESQKGNYSVRERKLGKFTRTVALPKGTKADHIKAKMEDGILHVTFPRNQPDQAPTRIAIDWC